MHQFSFLKYYNSNILVKLASRFLNTSHLRVDKLTMNTSKHFKIYVTRNIPRSALNLLNQQNISFCQWKSDDVPVPKDILLENVQGIDALFCLLTDKIDADVIKRAGTTLKVIGTMSVGYDHLDLVQCKNSGITVGYTPDVLTDATAELTIALLLTVSRKVIEGTTAVKTGEWGTWTPLWMCGQTLSQSTVGICGLGRIGMAVAKRLKPFGVRKFLYTGHTKKDYDSEVAAEFVTFDALLQASDFIVVTCALTEETKGIFNKSAFKKMKKNCIFVNTSRGGIVNQDDLFEALTNKDIAAAGLDVTTPEPLPINSPLLALPNCVILPHIGSATVDTRTTMAELCARNILAALNGQPMPAELKF